MRRRSGIANAPPKEVFELILENSKHQIIWGGNYFTDYLPPSMGWLVWDKCAREFSLADGELAWCSQWKALRIFDLSRGAANQDVKHHPTQKPLIIMKKCIDTLPAETRTIVDPFMGSGTTGVAAVSMDKLFTGIERNPTYFDVCCKRISEAQKQETLF